VDEKLVQIADQNIYSDVYAKNWVCMVGPLHKKSYSLLKFAKTKWRETRRGRL